MTRAEAISTGLIRGNPQSQIDWECLRKVQHQTIGDAVSAAMKIAVRDNKRMKVYACRWCGRFHVANVKGKKGLKVVEDALELQRLREALEQKCADLEMSMRSNAWLRKRAQDLTDMYEAAREERNTLRLELAEVSKHKLEIAQQFLEATREKSFFQKLKDLF